MRGLGSVLSAHAFANPSHVSEGRWVLKQRGLGQYCEQVPAEEEGEVARAWPFRKPRQERLTYEDDPDEGEERPERRDRRLAAQQSTKSHDSQPGDQAPGFEDPVVQLDPRGPELCEPPRRENGYHPHPIVVGKGVEVHVRRHQAEGHDAETRGQGSETPAHRLLPLPHHVAAHKREECADHHEGHPGPARRIPRPRRLLAHRLPAARTTRPSKEFFSPVHVEFLLHTSSISKPVENRPQPLTCRLWVWQKTRFQ